jgi:hypothetical protein
MYKGKIPFDTKGKQMHYPENWRGVIEWRDNTQFEGKLKLIGMERGRSAVYFLLEDEAGNHYTMFSVDILGMLVAKEIVFEGTFEFCKRGMNYGVKLSNE